MSRIKIHKWMNLFVSFLLVLEVHSSNTHIGNLKFQMRIICINGAFLFTQTIQTDFYLSTKGAPYPLPPLASLRMPHAVHALFWFHCSVDCHTAVVDGPGASASATVAGRRCHRDCSGSQSRRCHWQPQLHWQPGR